MESYVRMYKFSATITIFATKKGGSAIYSEEVYFTSNIVHSSYPFFIYIRLTILKKKISKKKLIKTFFEKRITEQVMALLKSSNCTVINI